MCRRSTRNFYPKIPISNMLLENYGRPSYRGKRVMVKPTFKVKFKALLFKISKTPLPTYAHFCYTIYKFCNFLAAVPRSWLPSADLYGRYLKFWSQPIPKIFSCLVLRNNVLAFLRKILMLKCPYSKYITIWWQFA